MHEEDLELYLESVERIPPRAKDAEQRLLQAMQHDDSYHLVKRFLDPYLKWAAEIALDYFENYTTPSFSKWEAIQSANTGLVLAARKYKTNQEYDFKAYAKYFVEKELKKLTEA